MWFFSSKTRAFHENHLRLASPNERRCIARESLDFYRALIVGGVYEFTSSVDTSSIATFAPAVRQCVDAHVHLAAIVADAETKSPSFHFCPRLDLSQHIQILDAGQSDTGKDSEDHIIEKILPQILDSKWLPGLPPWKVSVIPFSRTRCFIGFSFSHSLADGTSGLAFHNTLLNALLQQKPSDAQKIGQEALIHTPEKRALSPPFDTAQNLPISWSFLLAPLAATFLPSFLGLQSHIDPKTPKTWTGSPMFYSSDTFRTNVRVLSIDAVTVDRALKTCRAHEVKLTGLIHQFIVSAILGSLPDSQKFDSVVAQTAMDMRQLVNVSKGEMGLYASGEKQLLRASQKADQGKEDMWESAKLTTQKLAAAVSRRQDQVIGLLRYLNDMHSWMKSKMGERRDGSYEVSNLLSFRPEPSPHGSPNGLECSVTKMAFAQPADATGTALSFNIVSVANGPLTIAITWQAGALDVEPKMSEVEFVDRICEHMEGSFDTLA